MSTSGWVSPGSKLNNEIFIEYSDLTVTSRDIQDVKWLIENESVPVLMKKTGLQTPAPLYVQLYENKSEAWQRTKGNWCPLNQTESDIFTEVNYNLEFEDYTAVSELIAGEGETKFQTFLKLDETESSDLAYQSVYHAKMKRYEQFFLRLQQRRLIAKVSVPTSTTPPERAKLLCWPVPSQGQAVQVNTLDTPPYLCGAGA